MNIQKSDITRIKVDCIINPANGLGVMHKGVSKILMREGGPEVQNSAKEACFYHGLYKSGQAYWGSSGFLKQRGVKEICHAVLIQKHPEKIKPENIIKSLENSISLIKEKKYQSFSIPALGINPKTVSPEICAKIMLKVLKKYDEQFNIHIIDINREFVEYCLKQIEGESITPR